VRYMKCTCQNKLLKAAASPSETLTISSSPLSIKMQTGENFFCKKSENVITGLI